MQSTEPPKNDSTSQKNVYRPLGTGSIRLLRLLPHKDENAYMQCQLFEYPLQELGEGTHLYEALSYVWGDQTDNRRVSINEHDFYFTAKLYAALVSLRNRFFERIIWVDAICINQKDKREKGEQILHMAEIYSKASRVIVWLGEAENNSDQALEEIRFAADDMSTRPLVNNSNKQAILTLLHRPWFKRIWVLQEVAAARSILIKCGSTEIDGYAFCIGLDSRSPDLLGEAAPDLRSLIRVVIYLIRGAAFRCKKVSRSSDSFSLHIRPLGELTDMYHTHKATERHDKIYALLGMSSDNPTSAGIMPKYDLPWGKLMKNLVSFVLPGVSVDTWDEKEIAFIKSKGCVLGKVSTGHVSGDGQNVKASIKTSPGGRISRSIPWLLQTSAKPVQDGDLICLLQGALKPTIIRLQEDHFTIVLIAAEPPKSIHTQKRKVGWLKFAESVSFIRDFVLFWDWETSVKDRHNPDQYNTLIQTNDLQSQHTKTKLENGMNNSIRTWNLAQILGDVEAYSEAGKRKKKAAEFFLAVVREKHAHSLECQCSQVPLLWAAENGDDIAVGILLAKDDVDLDSKDYYGRTPLSWAAAKGHEAVVKLLLATGNVDVDSKDIDDRTPLSWAAGSGHEAVVKLLLATGKVDVDSRESDDQTPLSFAAKSGHEAVVKLLLLATGEVDSRDNYSWTPLLWAAGSGHEAVVKLLLATGKADVDFKDSYGRTPLSWAAENGHEAVVKLLLAIGKVDVDFGDSYDRTSLSHAAEKGHEAIVKLLLATDKVDIDSKDNDSQTSLSRAARNGHEAVVKLLLATGKADVDFKDSNNRTPLSQAAEKGHEAIVKLLLATGKVDVDSKDSNDRTPLSWATRNKCEAVVKLLLATGKVDVDYMESYSRTPLSRLDVTRYPTINRLR